MEEENGLSSTPRGGVVSLDLELGTLASAIQGARMLADLHARRDFPDAEMERNAPACIVSVLALATERLGQLRRVVRNEEDPANLWTPHNAVEDPATGGEFPGDIVLFPRNSLRLPLVMWSSRRSEPQVRSEGRTSRGRRVKSRKPSDVTRKFKVPQGEPPSEPELPVPTASDPGQQHG